jgi:PTS system ascorbate-specific IIC component
MDAFVWIANNVFSTPAIMLGCIVLAGLLLQGKDASHVIVGTSKAIIGFLIINAGSSIITGALDVFSPLWQQVFGIQSTAISNYMGEAVFTSQFGSTVAVAMALGFIINVLLACFTPFKYIYLTGHMMYWVTVIFAGIAVQATNGKVGFWPLTIFLSIIMGVYWTLQPAIIMPLVKKVTGSDAVALGHTSCSAGLLGYLGGKLFGNKEDDAEQLDIPKKFAFLRDSNVITALIMAVLFIIGSVIVMNQGTPEAAEVIATSGTENFIVYVLVQSFTFAGGIAVVLTGVRMFIGEIVPAFKGIADKVVPGAKPALDAPFLYTYAPNSVVYGFLGAFVGALLWMVVLGNTVGYVFVPPMIALFFHGAVAGIFGNKSGGLRGALIGGLLCATLLAWGQYVMVTFFIGTTIPDTALWAADCDMFILGPVVGGLAHLLLI